MNLTRVIAVIYPEDSEDVEGALEDSIARGDDAYWARYVRRRFTWRRFMAWWVARRFIEPRDVRKR